MLGVSIVDKDRDTIIAPIRIVRDWGKGRRDRKGLNGVSKQKAK